MTFGNPIFIQHTLDILQSYNKTIPPDSLRRELDGRIAFSVLAREVDATTYAIRDNDRPYALVMNTSRSANQNDIIEFEHPTGDGWIIMADSKVPHYTTSLDDAFSLLKNLDIKWSITEAGLVTIKHLGETFKQKLSSPQMSICAIGLRLALRLYDADF